MFDPQYIRPDDVGTQRNKSLLLTKPDTVQAVESVAYRSRDQNDGGVVAVPVIAHDRRKAESRDRRQQERRLQHQSSLLDTRSHRERRKQCRRQHDAVASESDRSFDGLRVGVNEIV